MATHRLTGDHYTLKDIERGIRNKQHLYVKGVSGDASAIDLIVDAERCIELAKPTEVQAQAVRLVWEMNYTLQDAGDLLGVTPQAVRFNIQLLSVKIKAVLDEWKHKEVMQVRKKEIRKEREERKKLEMKANTIKGG